MKLCYDVRLKSSKDCLTQIPKAEKTLGFLLKWTIYRGLNSFINRAIRVCRSFNCKLKGKLFSSEVERELICLNTKTLCRRGSNKGSKTKPKDLILNWIQ